MTDPKVGLGEMSFSHPGLQSYRLFMTKPYLENKALCSLLPGKHAVVNLPLLLERVGSGYVIY